MSINRLMDEYEKYKDSEEFREFINSNVAGEAKRITEKSLYLMKQILLRKDMKEEEKSLAVIGILAGIIIGSGYSAISDGRDEDEAMGWLDLVLGSASLIAKSLGHDVELSYMKREDY